MTEFLQTQIQYNRWLLRFQISPGKSLYVLPGKSFSANQAVLIMICL